MFRFYSTITFLVLLTFASCKDNTQIQKLVTPNQVQDDSETPLLRGNKKMLALENENIELFIKRYNWNMIKTGTGLRYEIVQKGTGSIPKKGDVVELEFVTQLLTGDTIYTSKEKGLKKFQVEKTDEIVGLHETVQLMPKGSVAHVVIPSYMAYGISGDGDQIFGQHALVMTIKILNK
jgi:FKBP-type peptidyl-prolyl cis-trans isomerase